MARPAPTRLGTQELSGKTQIALDARGTSVQYTATPQLYHDEKIDRSKERKNQSVRHIHESIEPWLG